METSQELEARYRLTYGERLRAAWDLTLGSPAALLSLCIFPVLGFALIWTMSLPTSRNNAWDYLLVAACFAFMPFMFFWNTFRAHRADRSKGPYHYRFNSEGIHVTTPTSELTHHWPAILRVRESRGILYLYFTKRCAHIVPLRVLSSPSASQAVQQLAIAAGVSRVGT
jgi:hypothetical protein